jgi:mannitol/fructose-specific phosphotransferase system IIA component (Ntr-type)
MTAENHTEALDRLLTDAAESLDIPSSRLEDAIKKYEAVGTYLLENPSALAKYHPDVYPQGSLATGTCVKPLGRDEFDLDLVCEMAIPASMSQQEIKNAVGDRFKESKTYKDMLEEKKRCWRLNYANQFHMDILPGKPADRGSDAIFVPDKELSRWKPSNPRGYAKWFRAHAMSSTEQRRGALTELTAAVEPINEPAARPRYPLQKAIQLLKRHRDVMFSNRADKESAPVSIIITTLAAKAYKGLGSVILTMQYLVSEMPKMIERDAAGRAWIRNPTNPTENFADKWSTDQSCEKAFKAWMTQVQQDTESLAVAQGIPSITKRLEPFLGQKRTKIVIDGYAARIEQTRADGLYVDKTTGQLDVVPGLAAAKVRRNTFFGD